MIDPTQRESLRQALLDQPGAAEPGWVDNWVAIYEAQEDDREARLVADIQTLIEHDVEGVEDMNAMEVFVAILALERD